MWRRFPKSTEFTTGSLARREVGSWNRLTRRGPSCEQLNIRLRWLNNWWRVRAWVSSFRRFRTNLKRKILRPKLKSSLLKNILAARSSGRSRFQVSKSTAVNMLRATAKKILRAGHLTIAHLMNHVRPSKKLLTSSTKKPNQSQGSQKQCRPSPFTSIQFLTKDRQPKKSPTSSAKSLTWKLRTCKTNSATITRFYFRRLTQTGRSPPVCRRQSKTCRASSSTLIRASSKKSTSFWPRTKELKWSQLSRLSISKKSARKSTKSLKYSWSTSRRSTSTSLRIGSASRETCRHCSCLSRNSSPKSSLNLEICLGSRSSLKTCSWLWVRRASSWAPSKWLTWYSDRN